MAQKITHWLLVALILSLGFGQLLRFDFFGLPLYLHDILIVLILSRTVLDRRPEQSSSRDTEGGRTVLMGTTGIKLFLAGLALGWLFAFTQYRLSELIIPTLYTLRLLSYLALYYVLKQLNYHIPRSIILISGLVILSIGLVQYFYLPDMRIFQHLGWDDHLNRLTLPHFDPTFTAVMLGLALLSTLKSTPRISLLAPLSYTLGILLTYSRSVWLSLVFTAVVFFRPKKYILILIPILLVGILLLPKRFGEGTNLLRTYSIESRLSSDLTYLRDYNYSLLVGRGLNTLILDNGGGERPNHATGPNNSYLYILVTTGLLGLIGWVLIWRDIYRTSRYKPMLLFFFLASLFNNVMLYPFAILWVLLLESET